MYNFLVTSIDGAWDSRDYEYPRDRFCEHTHPDLKTRFDKLTHEAIDELKRIPTLFAYEGMEHPVRIGYITAIEDRGTGLFIEFDFDARIDPIPFARVEPLRLRLDLKNRFELNRTHWAIKGPDLLGILASGGAINPTLAGPSLPHPAMSLPDSTWRKLGAGGFGAVYRVPDQRLGMDFAVKVFDPHPFITSTADARERFLREAGLLFRLHHEHIVRILDAGELLNGQPYIKMEFLNGKDLQKSVNDRRLAPVEATSIAFRLARALQHAHGRGIVHRDIKPSNILVVESLAELRLIDFGLGILVEEAVARARLTTSSQQFGNAFAAPELLENSKSLDPRLDVYSLGAVWFWMLAGRSPQGTGIDDAIAQFEIDAALRSLLRRCLAGIEARPTAADVVEAFDAQMRRPPTTSARASISEPPAVSAESTLVLVPYEARPPFLRRADERDERGVLHEAYYVNLAVTNVGPALVRRCQACVTAVATEDADGWRPDSNWVPLPLLWAFYDEPAKEREMITERQVLAGHLPPRYVFNLCRISKAEVDALRLTTTVSPHSQRVAFSRGGYRFRVTVYAENADPADCWYEVRWNGDVAAGAMNVSQVHARSPEVAST